MEVAGTELDMGFEGDIAPVPSSAHPEAGGGTTPPERKAGQRVRSSGDVPASVSIVQNWNDEITHSLRAEHGDGAISTM